MKNVRTFAIMTAIIIMAVTISSVQVSEDSGATAIGDNTTVYLVDGSDVSSTSLYSYDLYQALVSASAVSGFALDGVTATQKTVEYDDGASVTTLNSSWNQKIHTGYQTVDEGTQETYYYNPNEDYGTLASVSIDGVTYTDFGIYVYQKADGGASYSWVSALDAIGWYHPFADYSATYSTSNSTYSLAAAAIAIAVNGGDYNAITSQVPTPMSITSSTDGCLYSFVLKGEKASGAVGKSVMVYDEEEEEYEAHKLTREELEAGIEIYGWGSNAHEALKVALCSQVDAQTEYATYHVSTYGDYYTYYGWYNEILGVGTQSELNPDGSYTYHWWQTSSGTGTNATETEYSLCYYSGLTGSPNSGTEFQVVYV